MKRKMSLIVMLSFFVICAGQVLPSNAAVQQYTPATTVDKTPVNGGGSQQIQFDDTLKPVEVLPGTAEEQDKVDNSDDKTETSGSSGGFSLSGMQSAPSAGFNAPSAGKLHDSVYGNSGNVTNTRGYKFVPSESAARILNGGQKK